MTGIFRRTTHPACDFVWVIFAVILTVWAKNPFYSGCALVFSCAFLVRRGQWKKLQFLAAAFPLVMIFSAMNIFVSHWGSVVLYADGDTFYTLEALLYGMNTGLLFCAMVSVFMVSGTLVTGDKMTFLLAGFFPAISLMLVMILRLIPFVANRARAVHDSRKAMNLANGTDSMIAVLGSTLEDGTFMAQSMENRGYGRSKRSSFRKYGFGLKQKIYLAVILVLASVVMAGFLKGLESVDFYDPSIYQSEYWESFSFGSRLCGGMFAVFLLLPFLFDEGAHGDRG